jgi:hypothetical protein
MGLLLARSALLANRTKARIAPGSAGKVPALTSPRTDTQGARTMTEESKNRDKMAETVYLNWAEFIPEQRSESFLADLRKLAHESSGYTYEGSMIHWEGSGVYRLVDDDPAESYWLKVNEDYSSVVYAMRAYDRVAYLDGIIDLD